MADRKPDGNQADAINRTSPFVQMSLDLNKQDKFVKSFGVTFSHYKAMPSPIGLKDRGDYRRSDGVDTITSNGMIYKCAGTFTATMEDNERNQKSGQNDLLDTSQSRLVLPRFYEDGKTRIYMAPGDRIYISDPQADVLVSNYQRMDYESGQDNVPMFPISKLEVPIVDSQNKEYVEGVDYCITQNGNIRWLSGGKNPGIDPDTGKGRVYSVRYLYKAYWYVVSLPKEVRVTGVTNGNVRTSERMPYHAVIVREYIYHNQNKGGPENQNKSKDPQRAVEAPTDSVKPDNGSIAVDMAAFGDDGEQS
jgi:hypothetical protein